MAKNLTAKQEAFVQAYLRTGHQRAAYRAAYDAENMTDAVVDVKASELMRNGKVSVRLAEMQERTAKRTEITVETITAMLGQTYKKAAESRNHAACVAAAMGLAKVHGLIIDHKHVKQQIEDNRDAKAVSDEELLAIARRGSKGTPATEDGEDQPDSVH
ncbi:MAG: hypothetical protein RLZ60_319 [Pseudomonadota bacterium]